MRISKRFQTAVLAMVCGLAIHATVEAQTTFTFPEASKIALVSDDFYTGSAGLHNATPDGFGRWAYFAVPNNAGTQAAFIGLNLSSFDSFGYIVDLNDDTSWRPISTTDGGVGLDLPVWSLDDQYVTYGGIRFEVATGTRTTTYLSIASEPDLATACVGPGGSFEFNTDGDAEGWDLGGNHSVGPFTVSGGLLHGSMTGNDPSFSVGGLNVNAATNTRIVFRMRHNQDARVSGQLFFATDSEPGTSEDKSLHFDLGPTGVFNTYVLDVASNPKWVGSIQLLRIDPSSSANSGTFDIDYVRFCSGTDVDPNHQNTGIADDGSVYHYVNVGGVTNGLTQNFSVGVSRGPDRIVATSVDDSLASVTGPGGFAVPLLNNSGYKVDGVGVSNDGSMVSFTAIYESPQPDFSQPGYLSDIGDTYVLTGVDDIIAGNTAAATSLNDPRIIPIRTQSEGGQRYKIFGLFTADNQYVLYTEDFNNQWLNSGPTGTSVAESFVRADFDLMISKINGTMDGANDSNDLRFANAGNQLITGLTRTGLRAVWQAQPGATTIFDAPLRIFMGNMVVSTNFDTESDPAPANVTQVIVGGQPVDLPFTTTDSAVVTTAPVAITDAGGTVIDIPADVVVNFPDGTSNAAISIETPPTPVTEAQLPDDAEVDAIPVQREFGPSGTQFYPSIPVTITYTDEEIAGLDELTIRPYLFNTNTNVFDIPVTEDKITERNTEANSITFLVDHFSVYGLGFGLLPASPQHPWTLWAAVALLIATGVFVIGMRMRRRNS